MTNFNINAFVDECRTAAAGVNKVEEVSALMRSALSQEDAVLNALPPIEGDETLVHACDHVLIAILRLTRNVHYPPHEHNMPVVMGILQGEEHNTFYQERDNSLQKTGAADYQAGEIVVIGEDAIHSVVNLHEKPSIGFHAYLGPLQKTSRRIWSHDGARVNEYSDDTYFDEARAFDPSLPYTPPEKCAGTGV